MDNLPNRDKKLLDRFNALRPSIFLSDSYDCTLPKAKLASNLLESSIIRAQLKDTEHDLSIRLRKLRDVSFTPPENSGNTSSPTKLKQDSNVMDINLMNNQLVSEELQISPGQISVECEKLTEYENLFTEVSSVQNALKKVEKVVSIPSSKFIEPERSEISNDALIDLLDNMSFGLECDDNDGQDENERFVAQMDFSSRVNDIIAQVMDEVSLKQSYLPQQEDNDKNKSKGEMLEIENEELVNMPVFPSTPTSLCHPKKNFDGFSKVDLKQKPKVSAESLCGMSTMDFNPFQLSEETISQPTETCEKDFKDSDLDTWCIICQDDAGIICLSCDGDLYCVSCWEEGHTGTNAGLEERNHRWVAYKRK